MLIGSNGPLGSKSHGWPLSVRLLSRHRPDRCEWFVVPAQTVCEHKWRSDGLHQRDEKPVPHVHRATQRAFDQTGTNRSQKEGSRPQTVRSVAEHHRRPTGTRSGSLLPTTRDISRE